MSRPIIPILASYLSGLVAGYCFRVPFHILIGLTFITVSLAAAAILTGRRPPLFFTLSILALSLIGMARMNSVLYPFLPEDHISALASGETFSLEGTICDSPERLLDRTRLYIEMAAVYVGDAAYPVRGKLLLTIGDKEAHFKYGEKIRFLAKVKRPRNFHNPGGFDYERHLAMKGVFATAFLNDSDGIIKTAEAEPSFRGWIEEIRESIRDSVHKNAGASSPILLALITGDQGEIPKEVREEFSKAGTAHILAISGEHVPVTVCANEARHRT